MIKYHLNLFSAGLEGRTAGDSLAFQDRRQKLEAYCSRWEHFDRAGRTLLDPQPTPNHVKVSVDKGFLVYEEDTGDRKENIYFIRLPSVAMEIPQKEWMVRGLPATRGHQWAILSPLDLLAIPVLSREGR